MDKDYRLNLFSEELVLIKNPKYKLLLEKILEEAPAYFFDMAASTTGKYHPALSLGAGGLVRHTKVVAKIMILLSNLKMFNYTDNQKDLLLIAAIAHDTVKKGDNKTNYTVNNHPELAVELLKKITKELGMDEPVEELYDLHEFLLNPVETHMGEFGNRLPETEAEKLLHICDYLASRKVFEYKFEEEEYIKTIPKTEMLTMPFGKYKGKTLKEIKDIELDYLLWCNKTKLDVKGANEMINKFLIEEKIIK
jgi:uncharacterized protein (DUF3820 family)